MAYFNHAFRKTFLGTGADLAPVDPTATNPAATQGFITTAASPTSVLADLGVGYYGFYDAKTYASVTDATLPSCCPLILASASIKTNDKQGPYHGGYKESNKSKVINPRYVRQVYRVDSCEPQQAVVHVGATNHTCPVGEAGPSCTDTACCKEFYCGETYYLRIDVKGSPALRFANHQLYQTLQADGGCCPANALAPVMVDPTLIFLQWAKAVIINPYMSQMIKPIVYDYTGTPWFATAADAVAAGWTSAQVFENYGASPQAAAWTDAAPGCAGMTLVGAYVETKFGECSFQITDFFEKEPVKILVSEVDYAGDPCVFTGICVVTECPGRQGMGFGEQVLRDLILSESYLQNFFATDIRIREITQGSDILNAVDRDAFYTRYFILHSVPRYNNPSGVFDNDQYLLEIISEARNLVLETFLTTWLDNCSDCNPFDPSVESCLICDDITPIPEPPVIL
jgi:hypothetical protein